MLLSEGIVLWLINYILATMITVGMFFQKTQPLVLITLNSNKWFYYFSHNIKIISSCIIVGTLSYGIGSYVILAINAFSLGIAIQIVLQNNKQDLIYSHLLPHAIPELCGILLSTIIPFIIWRFIFNARNRHRRLILLQELIPVTLVSVILILIASIIESLT